MEAKPEGGSRLPQPVEVRETAERRYEVTWYAPPEGKYTSLNIRWGGIHIPNRSLPLSPLLPDLRGGISPFEAPTGSGACPRWRPGRWR